MNSNPRCLVSSQEKGTRTQASTEGHWVRAWETTAKRVTAVTLPAAVQRGSPEGRNRSSRSSSEPPPFAGEDLELGKVPVFIQSFSQQV